MYRCGGMPTIEDLSSISAIEFDALVAIPQERSGRSSSVFMSLSAEEALSWSQWRSQRGLDTTLWRVSLPDDAPVYAHYIHHFEDTESFLNDKNSAASKESATAFWEDSYHVLDFDEDDDLSMFEVLVPFEIAKNATWETLDK
jgi:hypothetical protein